VTLRASAHGEVGTSFSNWVLKDNSLRIPLAVFLRFDAIFASWSLFAAFDGIFGGDETIFGRIPVKAWLRIAVFPQRWRHIAAHVGPSSHK
jgi:hypothetical protein